MNNPKKYRELCVPFESLEAANAALVAYGISRSEHDHMLRTIEGLAQAQGKLVK